MKCNMLKLLLAFALVFQGLGAFGVILKHAACCGDGGQVAQTHCQHGHGAPCKPGCAHHCVGCTATAFVAVRALTVNAPAVSVDAPPFAPASARMRDDLPPTRPPIV